MRVLDTFTAILDGEMIRDRLSSDHVLRIVLCVPRRGADIEAGCGRGRFLNESRAGQ
jgi:hypothetical protein